MCESSPLYLCCRSETARNYGMLPSKKAHQLINQSCLDFQKTLWAWHSVFQFLFNREARATRESSCIAILSVINYCSIIIFLGIPYIFLTGKLSHAMALGIKCCKQNRGEGQHRGLLHVALHIRANSCGGHKRPGVFLFVCVFLFVF